LILAPLAVRAESLNPREIPADAKWAVHLDVKGLLSSRIGSLILEMANQEEEMKKVHAFGTVFEFDPFEDLYSVTAYGTSYQKEEGAVLLKGRFDREKITAMMSIEGERREILYLDADITQWSDGHDQFFVCFYRDGLILLSNSQSLIQGAIEVLKGDADSLADGGGLRGLRSLPEGTFIAAGAKGFGSILGVEAHATVLQKADEFLAAAGETEGIDFLDVTLSTTSEETASQVHQVLQGIIALGGLMSEQEPELARLVKSVRLKLDGRKITLRETQPADELFEWLKGLR
jgi:hypothetical protein